MVGGWDKKLIKKIKKITGNVPDNYIYRQFVKMTCFWHAKLCTRVDMCPSFAEITCLHVSGR
jgi:hypothetical protein